MADQNPPKKPGLNDDEWPALKPTAKPSDRGKAPRTKAPTPATPRNPPTNPGGRPGSQNMPGPHRPTGPATSGNPSSRPQFGALSPSNEPVSQHPRSGYSQPLAPAMGYSQNPALGYGQSNAPAWSDRRGIDPSGFGSQHAPRHSLSGTPPSTPAGPAASGGRHNDNRGNYASRDGGSQHHGPGASRWESHVQKSGSQADSRRNAKRNDVPQGHGSGSQRTHHSGRAPSSATDHGRSNDSRGGDMTTTRNDPQVKQRDRPGSNVPPNQLEDDQDDPNRPSHRTPVPQTQELDGRPLLTPNLTSYRTLKHAAGSSKEVHEIRPDFADPTSKNLMVLTNHFAAQLPSQTTKPLFKYTIGIRRRKPQAEIDAAAGGSGSTPGNDENEYEDEEDLPVYDKPTAAENATSKKAIARGKREEIMEWMLNNNTRLVTHRHYLATDKQAIVISWRDLRLQMDQADHETKIDRPAQVVNGKQLKELKTRIVLRYKGRVQMDELSTISTGVITDLPFPTSTEDTKRALNIILAKATDNANVPVGGPSQGAPNVFKIGAKKFYSDSESTQLEPGVIAYRGFFSAFGPGMGSPLLNVSGITTPFYESVSIQKFLSKFRVAGRNYSENAKRALIGVKVSIYGQDKQKTIKGFGKSPTAQTFLRNSDQADVSIYDHLTQMGRFNNDNQLQDAVKNSRFPCANLGTPGNAEWFPVEFLTIVQHQPFKIMLSGPATTKMILYARQPPGVSRANIISKGLQLLGITSPQAANSPLIGSGLSVTSTMLEVPARKVNPLPISYAGTMVDVQPQKCSWNLEGQKFLSTANHLEGKILALFPTSSNGFPLDRGDKVYVLDALLKEMNKTGITQSLGSGSSNQYDIDTIDTDVGGPNESTAVKWARMENRFTEKLESIKSENWRLVIFFNNDKSAAYQIPYSVLKKVTEQQEDIHSLCLNHEAISNMCKSFYESSKDDKNPQKILFKEHTDNYKRADKKLTQYMANVSMKINIKLGNVNHTFARTSLPRVTKYINSDPTIGPEHLDLIILGADVTHTQKDSAATTPSLAAVVGSVDDTFGKFLGSMRYQDTNTEIITSANMSAMVMERLAAWEKAQSSSKLPSKVLYYRDGVSEGQYPQVRETEVEAIRNAYATYQQGRTQKVDPKITAVVVTKRHHTRFYPKSGQTIANCSPGTVVESGVTHPCYFDFFLQSHNPIQGTAKPTYYFVLENAMGFSAKEIQDFTNWLCYTYVRATMPVSYAPPAYYADRLCERGRVYLRDFYNASDLSAKAKLTAHEERTLTKKEKKGRMAQKSRAREEEIRSLWKSRYHSNGRHDVGPWTPFFDEVMFWM